MQVNKKAQVGEAILFFTALILIGMSLFAIVSFKEEFSLRSLEIAEITNEVNFNKMYSEAQVKLIAKESIISCAFCSEEQLKEKIKENTIEREKIYFNEKSGNTFSKMRKKELSIDKDDEKYILEVRDLSVSSAYGESKVTQNFSVCMEFDEEGNFLAEC